MNLGVISVRYARALLKGATQARVEDTVYGEMQTLSGSYLQLPQLRDAVDNPMLSAESKAPLLTTACGGSLCPLTRSFLGLVLKEGREGMLQFMANSYVTLYRKQKNIISGKLTTAAPVSQETERRMRRMVEAQANGSVEFETSTDPALIGGFVLEYDTYRMDASVRTRLTTVLSHLKKQ